jgi:hypothetical protein
LIFCFSIWKKIIDSTVLFIGDDSQYCTGDLNAIIKKLLKDKIPATSSKTKAPSKKAESDEEVEDDEEMTEDSDELTSSSKVRHFIFIFIFIFILLY